MKFVVDVMLGKLAKWLKILGFDTLYFSHADDSELLHLAQKERRILLTRDHGLLDKALSLNSLYVESEVWEEQVEQILKAFHLWPRIKPYSRCIECNLGLKYLPKERARNLVAPFVFEQASSFAICPGCGKVYWQGTHFQEMKFKIDAILEKQMTGRAKEPARGMKAGRESKPTGKKKKRKKAEGRKAAKKKGAADKTNAGKARRRMNRGPSRASGRGKKPARRF